MTEKKFTVIGVACKLQKNGEYHKKLTEFSSLLPVGVYYTPPIYELYDLGLDAGLVENGNTSVKIEVYQICDKTLKSLDNFKSSLSDNIKYNLFNRKEIDSPFGKIQVYFVNIDKGDYFKITENVIDYYKRVENKINK
jgi:gamma-glutamylcyclotransferase (GGCT)/AIG2-like uncharacterized protein YtfP